jgi:hypothetical protein
LPKLKPLRTSATQIHRCNFTALYSLKSAEGCIRQTHVTFYP